MIRLALTILWPSFVMAGVLEALVFAVVDPADVRMQHIGVEPSPQAIYTLAFLIFWGLLSTSGAISTLLLVEIEEPPAPPRPLP
jgi:hypothetical protein